MFREEFIKGLLETLKIPNTAFNIAIVSDEIQDIPNNNLREFYKAVISADTFGNGMKAVINTAKNFKPESDLNLKLGESVTEAKIMYDKFYAQNSAMTDYAQANRDKVPNDRAFFENMNYSELKQNDGSKTYTPRELYVLEQLGGGSWLCDIKFNQTSKVAIDKIQRVIKEAISTKYSDAKQVTNSRVMKMLKVGA